MSILLFTGTELRASLLHDKSISTPEGLKAALEDPYLRQHYVKDADLQTATMDSIYNAEVKVDTHGNLVLSPVGGRRRIDVVLYRNDCPVVRIQTFSTQNENGLCNLHQTRTSCELLAGGSGFRLIVVHQYHRLESGVFKT